MLCNEDSAKNIATKLLIYIRVLLFTSQATNIWFSDLTLLLLTVVYSLMTIDHIKLILYNESFRSRPSFDLHIHLRT